MATMMVAQKPGRCAGCSGAIKLGEEFMWGRAKGERLHANCAVMAEPAQERKEGTVWSEYQERLFDWGQRGTGSAMVVAVAGAGKTSSIEEFCRRFPRTTMIKYLTFNKKNAKEAESRMPVNVDSATFHATAFKGLQQRLGRVQINGNKVKKLLAEMVERGSVTQAEAEAFGRPVCQLVSLAKAHGIAALVPDTLDQWTALVDHFGLDFDIDPRELEDGADAEDRAIEIARELLGASNAQTSVIDFDDQLYLTVKLHCPLPRYDVVCVDEAQDTNPVRRAIIRMVLKPGGRLVAVGDPMQAIYGFTGADADAMVRIQEEFNCVTLPLSINYRCSRAVIAMAQTYCPEIQARPNAPEGSVQFPDSWGLTDFQATDVVLCRVTAPLITLAYRLLRHGIGCTVLGRDIGEGLVALVRKMQGKRKSPLSIEELEVKLAAYLEREVAKWTGKGQEDKAQAVTDKVESVIAAIEGLPEGQGIDGLIDYINGLFSDEEQAGLLTLATVHKAKGLEWERVFILDPYRMPSKWARQAWQQEQENNLIYVAITRAKRDLYYIDAEALR